MPFSTPPLRVYALISHVYNLIKSKLYDAYAGTLIVPISYCVVITAMCEVEFGIKPPRVEIDGFQAHECLQESLSPDAVLIPGH